ncbi:hypothetical protein Tco_0419644 [Tanacetum coccineum]
MPPKRTSAAAARAAATAARATAAATATAPMTAATVEQLIEEWLCCHNGSKRWNQCYISATVLWRTKLSLLLTLSLEML